MERWQFDLTGGHLALDFSNTVSSRHADHPVDHLGSYPDLVEFARQTKVVTAPDARRLLGAAAKRATEAEAVLGEAKVLREALYRIFAALGTKEAVQHADVEVLNTALAKLKLDDSFEWHFDARSDGLDFMMGPVLRSALELLTTGPRDRVRMCEADDCVWVFLDMSKNRSRRWCDMAQCGNRMKARRFYSKHVGA